MLRRNREVACFQLFVLLQMKTRRAGVAGGAGGVPGGCRRRLSVCGGKAARDGEGDRGSGARRPAPAAIRETEITRHVAGDPQPQAATVDVAQPWHMHGGQVRTGKGGERCTSADGAVPYMLRATGLLSTNTNRHGSTAERACVCSTAEQACACSTAERACACSTADPQTRPAR